MVWWRTFLLVLSLALAGPLPVSAASPQSADSAASATQGAADEPCHHDQATDLSSAPCCAGQDMASHCGTAACASACTPLLGPQEVLSGVARLARAGPRPELPVPRGRSVAPEEPPPTA